MEKETNPLKHFFYNLSHLALGAGILTLLLGLGFGSVLAKQYQTHLMAKKRQTVETHLAIHVNYFQVTANRYLGLLEGLHNFVQNESRSTDLVNDDSYENIMASLYSSAPGIRNFSIAPGGVQGYVFPLQGNENVLGHDLLHDERPDVQTDIQRTIEMEGIVLNYI